MTDRWSPGLCLAHWLSVALVAVQLALAAANAALYEPHPVLAETLVQAHLSVGALLFVVTLGRLAIRFGRPAPAGPASPILQAGAVAVHGLLYACLLLLPVTGYLKLAALDFRVTLFGLVALPPIGLDLPLAEAAQEAHRLLSIALAALLVLHLAAALGHRHLDGRSVLHRIGFDWRGSSRMHGARLHDQASTGPGAPSPEAWG